MSSYIGQKQDASRLWKHGLRVLTAGQRHEATQVEALMTQGGEASWARPSQIAAICIDEAQHLMHSDAAQRPGVQLDWLKSLSNRANLLYILVGNFSLYDFCHLNGQAARRMRDEHFARYHFSEQEECENFIGALKALLAQVPLQVDIPEILRQWQWFGEWSIGCVGNLSDWVVETVSSVCRKGQTTLTIDDLKKHALKPDQRFRLETEARQGEFKIE